MKKILSLSLLLALMIPLCVGIIPAGADTAATQSTYKWPTADDLGGYENVNLTYTFKYSRYDNGRISKDQFKPYVAYLDKNGNIKDYFFDSYLFLPCTGRGPSGNTMQGGTTKAIDWTSYVNDTFYSGKNVDALEDAFGDVKKAMGDADKKAGVFFTILYPSKHSANFGSLGGKSLDFTKVDDQKYAIKWIIDEQIKLFNDGEYKNLDLVGFYWYEETINSSADIALMKYASDYLHSLDLKFIWIPYYLADGYNKIGQMGFDAVCMQPNLYWLGYTDPFRVNKCAEYGEKYGMGMEIEVDFTVSDDYYFNRYLYYLEGGMQSGIINSVKMYYQDQGPGVYSAACYSYDETYRAVYDLTYKYAKGTLTQADIDDARPEGMDDNYVENIDMSEILKKADWVSIGKTYTGCESYVDGNGAAYQNVSGKELTDGIIAKYDLSTNWFAFHESIKDEENRYSITIDLGEKRDDIAHFAAHFFNKHLYAIGSPMDIKIYASEDGRRFTHVASPELILDPVKSVFYVNIPYITARYIKLSIGESDKMYIFCSEFLVGIDHVHKPAESWSSDKTHHWHECPCEERFDTEEHTLGEWKVVKEADIGITGKKERRCIVCDCVVETEAIPAIPPKEEPPKDENSDTSSDDNSGSSSDEPSDFMLGDINKNKKIDMTDYILLKRNYFGTYTFDEDMMKRGDINKNGKIDMTDYILLKRVYFGTYTI